MTTTLTNFRRSVRGALLAILSAALLAACGGGDNAEEIDAAAASSLRESGAALTVDVETAPVHRARSPAGGWRRAPICLDTAPTCPPNVPPTQ